MSPPVAEAKLKFAAAISLVLQLFYVLALLEAMTTTVKLIQIVSLYGKGDPKMMAGGISVMLVDLFAGAAIGLVGVAIAWWVLRDRKSRPLWFVTTSKVLAWAWIPFIPVGTVIGVLMLRWCKPEARPEGSS